MAKLPDWVIEARDKASDLDGYASDAEDKKACADYDFRRAMLWDKHGTDLIRKIEQQADKIEWLESVCRGHVALNLEQAKKIERLQADNLELQRTHTQHVTCLTAINDLIGSLLVNHKATEKAKEKSDD